MIPPRIAARRAASAIAFIASAAQAQTSELSDAAQTLRYRVAWNGLTADGATVSIKPEELAGRSAPSICCRARSLLDASDR